MSRYRDANASGHLDASTVSTPRPASQLRTALSQRDNVERVWLHAAAGFLLLGGPVWHALYSGRYPFSRPEAIVLPLLSGAIGVALALLARSIGKGLGILVYGALLFVFADLQFEPEKWTYTAVVVVACVALTALVWQHRAAISSLGLATMYLTSLAQSRGGTPALLAQASVARAQNPPIVHLILDEQAGVGGLFAAGDSSTAEFLRTFYASRGFELYEGAYSRYRTTEASIPSGLSLGAQPIVEMAERWKGGPRWRRMRANPYFRTMRERGYDVRVFANTFLDYCNSPDAPVTSCVANEHNIVRNFGTLEGPAPRRALWVTRYLLTTRSKIYQKLKPESADTWEHAVVGGGLETANQLVAALDSGPRPGTLYFAHLLAPHQPADVDAECRLLPRASDRVNYPGAQAEAEHRKSLLIVGGQERCVHRSVAEVLAAIDRTVGRDGAIVIIHGDHGNRLDAAGLEQRTLASYTRDELIGGFSTLFAIRRPHVAGRVRGEPVPTQDLFWSLVRARFSDSTNAQWVQGIRQGLPRAADSDTLRLLSTAEMPWSTLLH